MERVGSLILLDTPPSPVAATQSPVSSDDYDTMGWGVQALGLHEDGLFQELCAETIHAEVMVHSGIILKKFKKPLDEEKLEFVRRHAGNILTLPPHPSLCDIYKISYVGQDTNVRVNIQCEYIYGTTLNHLLYVREGFKLDANLEAFIKDMLGAVKHLKDHDCVWGDISPDNIFRTVNADGSFSFRLFDPSFVESAIGSGLKVDYADPMKITRMTNYCNEMNVVQNDYWAAMICVFEMVVGHKTFESNVHDFTKIFILGSLMKETLANPDVDKPFIMVNAKEWNGREELFEILKGSLNVRMESRTSVDKLISDVEQFYSTGGH
eukprot:753585-Hanusia_phi.AAC.7